MIVPNQITVPVRIGTVVRDFGTILFGSVRGTKLFGSVRGSWFWYEILVRYYLVRYVVRNFGTKLSGSVRVRTLGSWFPDRYEMVRFGSYFSKNCFFRTEPFTNRLIWYEIGSVRSFGKIFLFFEPITNRANYVPNKLVRKRFGSKKTIFWKIGSVPNFVKHIFKNFEIWPQINFSELLVNFDSSPGTMVSGSICRDPRTAKSVRICKVCRNQRTAESVIILKRNAGIHGPQNRSEF